MVLESDAPGLPLIRNAILKNKQWLTDILGSSFSVSPGGLLLCFLLCFSPALPRIPDYWVRYKLNGDDLPREHLAALFPWHFLCVKALLKYEKGKKWKYWLLDWCISLLTLTMKHVKRLVSPHWGHMKFVCFSYSTVYTMFPVFSLVLDKDVKSEVAMLYPELYKDLLKVFNECSHTGFQYRNVYEKW